MTEHLPECWATYPSDPPAWCICDELRACETRVARAFHQVRVDDAGRWEKVSLDNFDAGYAAAVIDAVQRVEALNFWEEHVREFVHRDEAIAAIKGDSND